MGLDPRALHLCPVHGSDVKGGRAIKFLYALMSESDPGLSSWQLSAGLATAHVGGSDTQALGGDLAYYYSENRGLAGMNLSAAQAVVQDPQYGIAPQTVHPWSDISGGAVHL